MTETEKEIQETQTDETPEKEIIIQDRIEYDISATSVKEIQTKAEKTEETIKITDDGSSQNQKKNKKKKKSGQSGKDDFKISQRKSYIHVHGDYGDERAAVNVQEIVDNTENAVSVGKTTLGTTVTTAKGIRTGIIHTKNAGRKIATAVRSGNIRITKEGVRKAAGSVIRTGAVMSVKGARSMTEAASQRILTSEIDKSKVTETGIESLKQGATYLRYAENTRRAGVNTIKTAQTIKNTPHNIKVAAKKAKSAVSTAIRLVTSKWFWIVIGIAAVIILLVTILSGAVTSVFGVISSIFGWLDSGEDKNIKDQLQSYFDIIKTEVDDRQKDIDDTYYGFTCDKQQYGDKNEITEFRDSRFTYRKIDIDEQDEYIEVLAIAAAKWYSNILENGTSDDVKFQESQLQTIVQEFYQFEYSYEDDYCPHYDCCHYGKIMVGGDVHGTIYSANAWYCDTYYHGCEFIAEYIEYKDGAWEWGNVHSGGSNFGRNFCTTKHQYLVGGVTNYTSDEVMNHLGFTDDQRSMYQLYYEKIKDWQK